MFLQNFKSSSTKVSLIIFQSLAILNDFTSEVKLFSMQLENHAIFESDDQAYIKFQESSSEASFNKDKRQQILSMKLKPKD